MKALHARLSDRPCLADYVVCVVGSLYSRIIDDWELADIRNLAAGVRRFGSRRRERSLSPAERRAVLAEIDAGLHVPRSHLGHIEPVSDPPPDAHGPAPRRDLDAPLLHD